MAFCCVQEEYFHNKASQITGLMIDSTWGKISENRQSVGAGLQSMCMVFLTICFLC